MRKVVDSNFLQREELRTYLARSRRNYAVLSDYAAMEAYKGDTLASIYKSMAILSEYPRQVIILKGTQTVCGLSGRTAGLQRRLISESQTRQFSVYCRQLLAARHGDQTIENQLLRLGRDATVHMDRVLADAKKMATHFEKLAELFTQTEVRALRTGARPPDVMLDKMLTHILWTAGFMFRDHPRVKKLPKWKETPNTLIFRASVCFYLLALRWISVGGAKGAKPEKIRNDIVDINFAAYATFFDGLLTCDKKLAALYKDAVRLRKFFDPTATA
jgi:hypothetical protein